MRSAISIYYGEMEGFFPTDDLTSLITDFKFFSSLPNARTPNYHSDDASVVAGASQSATIDDAGGWSYVNNQYGGDWGKVWVNCTHTDTKGDYWTEF